VSHSDNCSKLATLKPDIACFEQCADYLNIRITKDDNVTALFSNKASIAKRIVLAIEGLFPGKCEDCDEIYSPPFVPPTKVEKKIPAQDEVEAEEAVEDEVRPAVLTCYTCFRESHAGCSKAQGLTEALAALDGLPMGIVWLCHTCREAKNPLKQPKKVRKCSVTQSAPGTPVRESGAGTPVEGDLSKKDQKNKISEEDLAQALKSLQEEQEKVDLEVDAETKKKEIEEKLKCDQGNGGDTKVEKKICQKYKLRTCPHGSSGTIRVHGRKCPDDHPTRCRKYCLEGSDPAYGCNKGRSCKYWHPIICKFSLQKRHCSNDDCTFTHLRGTWRGPLREERRQPHSTRNPAFREQNVQDHPPRSRRASHRDGPEPKRPPTATNQPVNVGNSDKAAVPEAAPPNLTTSEPFLQLVRLVTTLQEEYRKEQEEHRKELSVIKSSIQNLSLVSQQNNNNNNNNLPQMNFPQMSFPQMNYPPEMVRMSAQHMPATMPPMNLANFPLLPNSQLHCS